MGLLGGFAVLALQRGGALRHPLAGGSAGGGCGSHFELAESMPVAWRFWHEPLRRAEFRRVSLRTGGFLAKWLAIAFLAESVMMAYVPASWVASAVGDGSAFAIPLAAVVGVPTYLNGYAAIPLIAGLVEMGMTGGAALAFATAGAVVLHSRRDRGPGGPSSAGASSPSTSASAWAERCLPASSTRSPARRFEPGPEKFPPGPTDRAGSSRAGGACEGPAHTGRDGRSPRLDPPSPRDGANDRLRDRNALSSILVRSYPRPGRAMHPSRQRIKNAGARAAVRHPGKYHGRATRSCRAFVVMLAACDRL